MKKAILFVVGLIALSLITNANGDQQIFKKTKRADNGKCFDESTHLINLGVGFGNTYYVSMGFNNGYASTSMPAISISYEQPWSKRLGPGFLGVGGILGYQSSSYRNNNYYYNNKTYYYEHSYRNSIIAARAVYHWDGLNFEKGEVYGGAIAGVRIRTYTYSTDNPDPDANNYKKDDGRKVVSANGVFAGARWYPIQSIALFAEAGYGISFITTGVTFKF